MTSKLKMRYNIPFVQMKVQYKDKAKLLNDVLVDTGSATSILKGELVREIGIKPEPEDILASIKGVGGSEFVYIKQVDLLSILEFLYSKEYLSIQAFENLAAAAAGFVFLCNLHFSIQFIVKNIWRCYHVIA